MKFNKINPTYYRKSIITIIFILLVSYSLTTSTYTDCFTETDIVYITKTGSKYHRSDCRYLRQSKIEISRDVAKKQGYTPCTVCKP